MPLQSRLAHSAASSASGRMVPAPCSVHRPREMYRQNPLRTPRPLHHHCGTGQRADRGSRRKEAASFSEADRQLRTADRRRAGLRPLIQDRYRTALRDAQPTLRTGIDSDNFEPAVLRVDRDPRLGTASLDRLNHHVHILEMNGESYRLKQSRRKRPPSSER